MEISPENIAQVQHEEWLKHPTTIQMFKNIETMKQNLVNSSANDSSSSLVTDQQIRMNMSNVKCLNVLTFTIRNTTKFLELATQRN